MHTCKIVMVTSLVWFVLDVAVIMYYSDCSTGTGGWGCGGGGQGDSDQRGNALAETAAGLVGQRAGRGVGAVDENAHDLAVSIADTVE